MRIGEIRELDSEGKPVCTRGGFLRADVHLEVVVAETQIQKLRLLTASTVDEAHSMDLALKATREARLCLTRAEKSILSMMKRMEDHGETVH